MKLIAYSAEGGHRAAVLDDAGGATDAATVLGEDRLTIRSLLESGRTQELAAIVDAGDPQGELDASELDILAPVPDPDKIICIGLNYRSHAEEAGLDPPEAPTIFAKFRNALAPAGAAVQLPQTSQKVDFEAEVAFVISRRCRHVDADAALDYVAGYMLLNDLSARDLQFLTPQWMPGKVFDGSAPCGPALVTPDEAGPHDAIEFTLDLNGERMQTGATDDLIFGVPELIAHLSSWMTLEPGDIISTGTPSGVGSVRDPRVWLAAGDEIRIESPTLGTLATTLK